MTGFAVADGALRLRLEEADWQRAWTDAVSRRIATDGIAPAFHPLAGTPAGALPHEAALDAAEVALGSPLGAMVATSRDGTGLVASIGLAFDSAAAVVRAVAGGREVRLGQGVEVSAFDLRRTITEIRRLLPRDLDAKDLPDDERVFTIPAELAAVAGRALRNGDDKAARQACRLAGLHDIPPVLEALTGSDLTATLAFRGPSGLRRQHLLGCDLGWVELTPTTAGMTHRLLDRDQLLDGWVAALALSSALGQEAHP